MIYQMFVIPGYQYLQFWTHTIGGCIKTTSSWQQSRMKYTDK